jgi:hypothetical protein
MKLKTQRRFKMCKKISIYILMTMLLLFLLLSCSDSSVKSASDTAIVNTDSSDVNSDIETDSDDEVETSVADSSVIDTDTGNEPDSDSVTDSGTDLILKDFCRPLPAATGDIITVDPSMTAQLQSIVSGLKKGDTVLFKKGIYNLNGAYLWVSASAVTLRSASQNPEDVIIDGGYNSTEIITVAASDVTIAEITIRKAKTHPIHVTAGDAGSITGTRIYRVTIIDPAEQGIKINPDSKGNFADNGEIACSHIQLTDDGRPHVNPTAGGCYTGGIDAHQARGWIIRDNLIEGFYCNNGLSEHAIHLWRGCRDTVVERNRIINNARGIGFGLMSSGEARKYDDNPCKEAGDTYIGHYGGIVRNNFVFADSSDLFATKSGFDCGICLASACGAQILHNTVVSEGDNFSSIEWRFKGSMGVKIVNNIATHPLRERDGATGEKLGNMEQAHLTLFENISSTNMHLSQNSAAIDSGVQLENGLCDYDIDGDKRDTKPDAGADERSKKKKWVGR